MSANSRFLNLDTDGTLSTNSDTIVPSQKAIKTYVDNKKPAWGDITGTVSNQTDLNNILNEKITVITGTLPDPSASTVGKVVQFVNSANQVYFYKGIETEYQEEEWAEASLQSSDPEIGGVDIDIAIFKETYEMEYGEKTPEWWEEAFEMNPTFTLSQQVIGEDNYIPAIYWDAYSDVTPLSENTYQAFTFYDADWEEEIPIENINSATWEVYYYPGTTYTEYNWQNLTTAQAIGRWGSIQGSINSQTDLKNALDAKLDTTTASSTYVSKSGDTMTGALNVSIPGNAYVSLSSNEYGALLTANGITLGVLDEAHGGLYYYNGSQTRYPLYSDQKASANGVASLDSNTKVPVAQIPDLSSTYATTSSLATVATSGSYNDLSNKPTIPTNLSDLTNDSGFIKNNDILLDYDPHSTAKPRAIFQQKLDDCFYRANLRHTISATGTYSGSFANLFDFNPDSHFDVAKGNTVVLTMEAGSYNFDISYPDTGAYIYLVFYYRAGPKDLSSISCRVCETYSDYPNETWHTLTGQVVAQGSFEGVNCINTIRFPNVYYGLKTIEITLDNTAGTASHDGGGEVLWLNEISFFGGRTKVNNLPVLTKLGGDTVYGNLTIPTEHGSFVGNLSGNASTATSAASATKATQDGNGDTISSTYLKLSGGTLTGKLTGTYIEAGSGFQVPNSSYLIFYGTNDKSAWVNFDNSTEHLNINGKGNILDARDKAVANGVASLDSNTKVPVAQIPDLSSTYATNATTLAGYGITNAYTKDEVDSIVSSVYKPAGSVAFASLPTLSDSVLGFVYNLTDSFTTDSRFIEGSGNTYPAGTNVVVVNAGTTVSPSYKFDVLSGFVDLSGYATKTQAAGSLTASNDTLTLKDVNGTTLSTATVNNVANATNATKATQDANGNNIANTYFPKSGGNLTGSLGVQNGKAVFSYSEDSSYPYTYIRNNSGSEIRFFDTNAVYVPGTLYANSERVLTESSLSNFVKNDDILYDYNAFANNSPHRIYQAKLDNTLYEADKRFTVTLTNFKSGKDDASNLFDGNAESETRIEKGVSNATILIEGPFNLGMDYPYGYIYLGFYYTCAPTSLSSVSCRVYQNWEGHNVGWVTLTPEEVCKTGTAITIMRFPTLANYGIEKIEITIDNTDGSPDDGQNNEVFLSDIAFFCNRTGIHALPVMTKWGSDTKYGNLTIPTANGSFIGNLTGNATTATTATSATKATQDGDGNNISSTYLKLSGGTVTGNLFVQNLYPTGYCYLGQDAYLVFKEKSNNGADAWVEQIGNKFQVNRSGHDVSYLLETKDKAVANGVASLDANAKLPNSQLNQSVYRESTLVSGENVAFHKYTVNDLYTVVGSPTIVNGVVSGFSASNYLDATTFPSNTQTIELGVKFKPTNSDGGCILFGRNFYLYLGQDTQQLVYAIYDTSTSEWKFNSTGWDSSILNKDAWVHLVDTGSSQTLELSLNGIDYNHQTTYSYTSDGNIENNALEIGSRWYGNSPFGGSIDLNETYIKVNGNYFLPKVNSTSVNATPTLYTAGTGIDITSGTITATGVQNQRSTSTAIKTWTGTLAQYSAITTKDPNTLYNVTDDLSATQTLLSLLYPVGSIYITTNSVCPLGTLISGSTWTLVSKGRVLQGADDGQTAGTTVEAGLPNITGTVGGYPENGTLNPTGVFGADNGSGNGGNESWNVAHTLTFDASRSNALYGSSTTVQPPAFLVNIFRRVA